MNDNTGKYKEYCHSERSEESPALVLHQQSRYWVDSSHTRPVAQNDDGFRSLPYTKYPMISHVHFLFSAANIPCNAASFMVYLL